MWNEKNKKRLWVPKRAAKGLSDPTVPKGPHEGPHKLGLYICDNQIVA